MARTPPARTVGQRPLIAVVALVVLAIGTTSLVDALTARQDVTDGQVEQVPAAPASPSPEPGRTAEVVGPVRGDEVAAYVEDRTVAMLEAPASVDTAVVSFTDVLSVQDAGTVVGGTAGIRAVLVRIPLDQATPQTVRIAPGDDPRSTVHDVLGQQVQRLEEELRSARELLDSGTVEDEDFIAEYERRVAQLEEALAAIERGVVVHAVVLRAPVGELQDLVDATAVRLVDPAPPGTDAALSVFHGLLPADTDTVSHGQAA